MRIKYPKLCIKQSLNQKQIYMTRANVIIQSKNDTVFALINHDGYPEYSLPILERMIKERVDKVVRDIRDGAENFVGLQTELYRNADYLYIMNFDTKKITCVKVD